jgi:hypothetical protein
VAGHLDDLENYLLHAAVLFAFEPAVQGGGGHAGKYAVVFDGGVTAYSKPSSGVADGGRAARNEAAAWAVARLLGWTDLMGATVIRLMAHGHTGAVEEIALQILWPGSDFTPDPARFTDDEIWRAALFDQIILHSDRMSNNWLGVPPMALPFPGAVYGGQQQLKLIDHGYAFDYPARAVVSSSFVELRRGQTVPSPLLAALSSLRNSVPNSSLVQLLGSSELNALVARVDSVISAGAL